jgi:hypothetical protein
MMFASIYCSRSALDLQTQNTAFPQPDFRTSSLDVLPVVANTRCTKRALPFCIVQCARRSAWVDFAFKNERRLRESCLQHGQNCAAGMSVKIKGRIHVAVKKILRICYPCCAAQLLDFIHIIKYLRRRFERFRVTSRGFFSVFTSTFQGCWYASRSRRLARNGRFRFDATYARRK